MLCSGTTCTNALLVACSLLSDSLKQIKEKEKCIFIWPNIAQTCISYSLWFRGNSRLFLNWNFLCLLFHYKWVHSMHVRLKWSYEFSMAAMSLRVRETMGSGKRDRDSLLDTTLLKKTTTTTNMDKDICLCKAIYFVFVVLSFVLFALFDHIFMWHCIVACYLPYVTMTKFSVHCNFIVFGDKTFPKISTTQRE